MDELKLFILISWFSLPTVMFGGYSFLMLLRGVLTPQQATAFRAGHAHAGVLLLLSLLFYQYLGLTDFSLSTKYLACTLLASGIILQSGGFFWHAFLDDNCKKHTGMYITTAGACLLATAVIFLAVGLAKGL